MQEQGGDVRRFHSGSALIAYAGIDVPAHQSGTMDMKNRHISKRGSVSLRTLGFLTAKTIYMVKPEESPVYKFIQKKTKEHKNRKLVNIAAFGKFLRIYYAKVTEFYSLSKFVEKNVQSMHGLKKYASDGS